MPMCLRQSLRDAMRNGLTAGFVEEVASDSKAVQPLQAHQQFSASAIGSTPNSVNFLWKGSNSDAAFMRGRDNHANLCGKLRSLLASSSMERNFGRTGCRPL